VLAERAATLDLMSGGRLELGVGKGYHHSESAGFCTPYEQAQARFEEALQVIIKAWTSNAGFSHNGRFWQYEDIIVEPPTSQKPHPPVWIAAGGPDSIRSVAARGCKLLLDQFASTETVGERLALFRAECEARSRTFDPMDVAVARNLYVARDAVDMQTALARLAGTTRSPPTLSALARKFADVFVCQAARVAGRSSRWVRRSRSARVNFHWNGWAICS
jgi:alkanesulfonate monooxygenase SsuD/methylene tetrahydromethanopterin reductase-like flavin-dependent oxidoreductase (luciferase family)